MSESRLDRIEAHMEQLIYMVAENNKMILQNNSIVQNISDRMDCLEQAAKQDRQINEARHKELLKEIRNNSYETDYLRNEVSKHGMEIHKLKASQ
ncbi:hypothetical protein [Aquibacillus albus]|uniref:DUF2524 family protein n=1 Tax=Aquibacillus albus TaxID=1168171 RepID=A0ABS2N5K5_9BACI|nr:hypothetical protein [Aquibacillus albus]MBM7573364.1 hypothetical protein [Aquibacillus albus]